MKHIKNPSTIQVSLILGLISLIVWFIPAIGVPVALIGLILGVRAGEAREKSKTSESRGSRTRRWAIGINSLGLMLAFIHGILGSIV